MGAAWTYFASWPQLAKDFAQLSQTKLTMPVLAIGGEKSLGNELGAQMKLVADNVEVVVLPNTGHWILEESAKGNGGGAGQFSLAAVDNRCPRTFVGMIVCVTVKLHDSAHLF